MILFAAKDLKIGGIEKALVTLINYLTDKNEKVTLVLEKKEGEFLKDLDGRVEIIEYTPDDDKNVFFRKLKNFIKRMKFTAKYKDKFDVAISFATYSRPSSFVARTASKNSILWCHADYLSLYNGNKEKVREFFTEIEVEKFSKIVFVSNQGKDTFLNVFDDLEEKTSVCNNLIDYKSIKELSKQLSLVDRDESVVTFLNVGRHDERQKKLSRIIEASKKLKDEKKAFRVVFVGDGPDTEEYKELVRKYNLEDYIIFQNRTANPYPYYRITDYVILSSDYEGYPVVFLESFILGKPIITTDISDLEDIKNGRGIVAKKSVDGIYEAMKKSIDKPFKVKNEFDCEKYNYEIKKKLDEYFKFKE